MNVSFKSRNAKSGVSLIVVMLFMLVATIAATATYKWITSQSRASSSRMLEREAYQSSLAGIENARAWIAWHANDAGALIKQYLDGGKKPVRMDRQLRSLQREGQSYSVWLTGVNTENSTYRFKILSKGESRNGAASHSEVAILNVDGLYQVRVPAEKKASKVDFDYAYFGGSTHNHGDMNPSSMLINGDWSGNPNTVTKNFVVTGNATLSGSGVNVGKLACVGGKLEIGNEGLSAGDLFVGGNSVNSRMNLTGNAYFDGNIEQGATGPINIQGSVTLNGKMATNQGGGSYWVKIGKNLCVAENGQVDSKGTNADFTVDGNVWMPGNLNLWFSGWNYDNYDSYNKILLGGKSASQVYIKTAYDWSNYNSHRNQKTFPETKNASRMCTQPKSGWPQCTKWQGWGWGARCVEWSQTTECDHWDHWEGWNYSPYPERAKKDNMYYLYDVENGVQDVEFKEYNNTYWGRNLAAYYVGGLLFYDLWSIWNEYHYYRNGSTQYPTGSPYCKKQGNYSNGATTIDAHRPVCGVNPWFKSNGTVSRNLPSQVPFECAEQVKTDCDAIWKKEAGCDGSNYKVEDMLVTAYSKFENYADKDCAKDITQWSNDLSKKLNVCYDEITKDSDKKRAEENLYNGYLVVKVRSEQLQNPSEALKGKFIIIVTNEIGQQNLPPTTSDSYVLLYLKEGGPNASIQPQGSGPFNYFIYTEKDVGQILFNHSKLSGTIYAAASSCSKVKDMTIKEIEYNKSLLEDLAENGIICNNDGSPCGGSGGSSTGGSSGSINYGGLDPHYISMAPQLGVSLESQYESREAAPENADETKIDSAYIVLPRIIYLPANPKGSLRDYYNVLALNGSKLKKENVSVNSCASSDASLSVSGSLYSGTALQKGVYECKTSASGYDENVPFWVVIGSEETEVPAVYFEKESQGINATGSAEINLIVDASEEIKVEFSKSDDPEGGWKVVPASGVSCTDNRCEITVRGTSGTTIPLYNITTTGATSGTFSVQLKEGNGYRLGSPWLSDVHISSNVQVKREEIHEDDLKKYCDEHPSVCPDSKNDWPKGGCESSEWVTMVSGVSCATVQKNEEWNCVAGGTGEGKLVESGAMKSGCVAIIPPESFDLSSQAANTTVSLHASVFAKKQKMIVGFTGDVGEGNHPKIDVLIVRSTGTVTEPCDYSSNADENKRCEIEVFQGDQVTLKLDTGSNDHKNFNYWKCENAAGNCPSGSDVLANTEYPAFTIQGSAEYSLIAHFGEADRHCFFDEFNRSQVICSGSFDEKEYCIDNCQSGDDGVCAGVSNGSTYTKAKWNLVSGELGNIRYENGSVSVERSSKRSDVEQSAVKVMSTVSAGLYGTMKALVQLPKATASKDASGANIRNSGLILRSNGNVSEYMVLNVYANASGNLEVQLCNENGKNCKSSVLTDNGSSASVSANAMVMVVATLKSSDAGDVLVVEASKDNYYGSPKAYSCEFELGGSFAKYLNRSYEYVGFGIADANFKIYGIGWKSEDYGSECHDTYPTVKCSFRAVAENGIVPTGKDVKPWLGHSAWFNSKSCTESYWYKNGTDACGGLANGERECPASGYNFDKNDAGLHGYKTENGEDVKAAYASLNCSVSDDAQNAWVPIGENERAHCGKFWTGEFTECSEHKILIDAIENYPYSSEAVCKKFDASVNLRAAKLNVELESADGLSENPDLEVFLLSKNEAWGKNDFESDAVKISRFGTSSFDVVDEMTTTADGFDPENVSGICFRNNGSTVRVKSVSSNCANAVSLSGCRVKYAGGSQWNVEADVSNPDRIQSFTVTRTVDSDAKSESFACNASDSKCLFDGTTAKLSFADDRNPYKEDQGKSYGFKMSLVGNGNATAEKECSVDPSVIGKITAECKIDGNSIVEQGKGLPKFSVTFTGCPPESGCAWKITTDNGKISKTGSKDFTSSFDDENKGSPWDPGTYQYRVEPASLDYPFDGCSSEFKIVAAKSSSSSEAELSSSSAAVGESSSSGEGITATCGDAEGYPEKKVSLPIEMRGLDANNIKRTILINSTNYGSFEGCNVYYCEKFVKINAPTNVGFYVYELYLDSKKLCSGNLTVKSPLSCSVDKTEIGLGESFVWTTSYEGSCYGSELLGDNVPSANCGSSYSIIPISLGEHQYIYKVTNGSNGEAACTTSVTVSEIAPTVECPDKLTKSVGSEISASPKSLTGCTNGCNWTLKDVNSQVKSGTIKNGEGFSFTGESSEGTKHYTFEVSNAKGSAECSFDVEYVAKPVYAGTMCLNAQYGEANLGVNKNGNYASGTYVFLHNCPSSSSEGYGWWYTCSPYDGSGKYIIIDNTQYSCDGGDGDGQKSTWNTPSLGEFLPHPSGSIIVVPDGVVLKNIGCPASNKEPVSGCSTTGVTMNQ